MALSSQHSRYKQVISRNSDKNDESFTSDMLSRRFQPKLDFLQVEQRLLSTIGWDFHLRTGMINWGPDLGTYIGSFVPSNSFQ